MRRHIRSAVALISTGPQVQRRPASSSSRKGKPQGLPWWTMQARSASRRRLSCMEPAMPMPAPVPSAFVRLRCGRRFCRPTSTGHATAQVNNGLINVTAVASAFVEGGTAHAEAGARGILQDAGGSTLAQAIFNNFIDGTVTDPGTLNVSAHALATATDDDADRCGLCRGRAAGCRRQQRRCAREHRQSGRDQRRGQCDGDRRQRCPCHRRRHRYSISWPLGFNRRAPKPWSRRCDRRELGHDRCRRKRLADGAEGTASAYFIGIDQNAIAWLNIPSRHGDGWCGCLGLGRQQRQHQCSRLCERG